MLRDKIKINNHIRANRLDCGREKKRMAIQQKRPCLSVKFFRKQSEKIKNIIEKMQKKVYTEIGMYNSEKKGET